MPSRPAVFLDRDGTLVEEAGYLDRLDRLVFFPYSVDAVRLLNRAGFAVVIVTNQAGIARGIFKEEFVAEAHRHITTRLEAGGAHVDAFYYCPHHSEGVIAEYRKSCDCRKPQSGLFTRAASEHDLALDKSFVVGDRWHDLEAGQRVGARGILVRTGYGKTQEAAPESHIAPSGVVNNVMEAVSWILLAS
jgi:D-glycero-D-manno-heptose 1,7-bisphosphate phosphatase